MKWMFGLFGLVIIVCSFLVGNVWSAENPKQNKFKVVCERIDYAGKRDLEIKVNELMDDGWKPLGGVAVYRGFGVFADALYGCQSMIR